MSGYPATSKDTVLYEEENIYGDKDITVTMLDGARLNIWGETWVNGGLVTAGTMPVATQTEAIAGTDNTKVMTPLQVANVTPYIDVRNYGAKGDGTTDDTTAIQAAFTAAGQLSTVVFPPGTYKTGTGTLTAQCPIDMMPGAYILSSATGVALLIDSVNRQTYNIDIRRVTMQWHIGVDTTSIGVRVRNCNYARLNVISHKFAVGVDIHGDNTGSSYGVIDCVNVMDNMVGLKFSTNGTGWANQWEVRGQIRINSGPPVGYVGTRYIDMRGANNVTVINLTMENSMPEYSVEISSTSNTFIGCRWESSSPIKFTGSNTNGNIFIGGYFLTDYNGVPASSVQFVLDADSDPPIIIGSDGVQTIVSTTGSGNGLVLWHRGAGSARAITVKAPYAASLEAIRAELSTAGTLSLYHGEGKGVGPRPNPIFQVDPQALRVNIGDGTVAATSYISPLSSTINGFTGTWRFNSAPQCAVASPNPAIHLGVNTNDPKVFRGTGDPNGVVAAGIGSHFIRTDGGAGTCFYVKESNTGGNTGWVAK